MAIISTMVAMGEAVNQQFYGVWLMMAIPMSTNAPFHGWPVLMMGDSGHFMVSKCSG